MENIHWHVTDSMCGKIRKRNRTHTFEKHMNTDPTLDKLHIRLCIPVSYIPLFVEARAENYTDPLADPIRIRNLAGSNNPL